MWSGFWQYEIWDFEWFFNYEYRKKFANKFHLESNINDFSTIKERWIQLFYHKRFFFLRILLCLASPPKEKNLSPWRLLEHLMSTLPNQNLHFNTVNSILHSSVFIINYTIQLQLKLQLNIFEQLQFLLYGISQYCKS